MYINRNNSEKIDSIKNYQETCSGFIKDISADYLSWVDRYNLGEDERRERKNSINMVVKKSISIIQKFGDTIKKIDIIMNDGINKMAENTAGYPFKFDIYVNKMQRYILHPEGEIKLNIKAMPNFEKQIRLARYDKNNLILIASSVQVTYTTSQTSFEAVDILDDYVIIDAKKCSKNDVISATVLVEEVKNESVSEKRGYSTLILIS